MNLLQCV